MPQRMTPSRLYFILAALVAGAGLAVGGATAASPAAQVAPAAEPVMPRYDTDRALLLPADYRQWVLAGTSIGLSYSNAPADHPMFGATLIEPSAYRHFARTGEFREGTMLVLVVQASAAAALPSRHGQSATDVHGVEMAVKDTSRVPEGWAYYNFGGMTNVRTSAQPQPRAACYSCHLDHAARDNVFTQFYALLSSAAPSR